MRFSESVEILHLSDVFKTTCVNGVLTPRPFHNTSSMSVAQSDSSTRLHFNNSVDVFLTPPKHSHHPSDTPRRSWDTLLSQPYRHNSSFQWFLFPFSSGFFSLFPTNWTLFRNAGTLDLQVFSLFNFDNRRFTHKNANPFV